MVLRPFDLHDGILYRGKTTSLYWIRTHIPFWEDALVVKWIKENIKAPLNHINWLYELDWPTAAYHP